MSRPVGVVYASLESLLRIFKQERDHCEILFWNSESTSLKSMGLVFYSALKRLIYNKCVCIIFIIALLNLFKKVSNVKFFNEYI